MSNKTELAKLPKEAYDHLFEEYLTPTSNFTAKVMADPQVFNTYAVRIILKPRLYKRTVTIDLIWNRGAFDEVEFESWPPVSGNLKFF